MCRKLWLDRKVIRLSKNHGQRGAIAEIIRVNLCASTLLVDFLKMGKANTFIRGSFFGALIGVPLLWSSNSFLLA